MCVMYGVCVLYVYISLQHITHITTHTYALWAEETVLIVLNTRFDICPCRGRVGTENAAAVVEVKKALFWGAAAGIPKCCVRFVAAAHCNRLQHHTATHCHAKRLYFGEQLLAHRIVLYSVAACCSVLHFDACPVYVGSILANSCWHTEALCWVRDSFERK